MRSGVIGNFPTGNLVQVVTNSEDSSSTNTTNTSTLAKAESGGGTPFNAVIVTKQTSDIYVTMSFVAAIWNGSTSAEEASGGYGIFRNTTLIYGGSGTSNHYQVNYAATAENFTIDVFSTLHFTDENLSPGTYTYFLAVRAESGSYCGVRAVAAQPSFVCTLMQIAR
tara:strand:- start:103 stop:603 length:501 start_codon:yes stop_codon:yes gene_type:complete